MIANDPDKKVAAMCVTGHLGDRSEWAIGEASPSNNKNNYPYAMAEKRAKDRVILKLLNMAGDYYSQDEADEFEEAKPDEVDEPPKKKPNHSKKLSKKCWINKMQEIQNPNHNFLTTYATGQTRSTIASRTKIIWKSLACIVPTNFS